MPPATTAQQTWKGPQAAQRLGVLFGREGVPSGPAQGGACGVSQVGPGASAVGRWSLLDPRRVDPAGRVPARSRAGGAVGYCVPYRWSGLFRCLGAQRSVAPPARRGSPFLPRNGEKEGRGQAPWTPGFRARSFPLARFGGCAALFRSWGYYGTYLHALIWRLSFAKMLFSIFFPENASQIGLRISEEIAPLPYQK